LDVPAGHARPAADRDHRPAVRSDPPRGLRPRPARDRDRVDRAEAEHAARAHGVDRDRLAQPGQDRRCRPTAAPGRSGDGRGPRGRPVTFTTPVLDLSALTPTIVLSVAAMIVLMIGSFVSARGLLTGLTLVGIAAAFVTSLGGRGASDPNAMVVGDGMSTFF